jgi:hypothetical protein
MEGRQRHLLRDAQRWTNDGRRRDDWRKLPPGGRGEAGMAP